MMIEELRRVVGIPHLVPMNGAWACGFRVIGCGLMYPCGYGATQKAAYADLLTQWARVWR